MSGKNLTPEVWGKFFLPKPNQTYPTQKSNGRLLTFPCAQEKRPPCFSMTTTVFLKTKKLVVRSKK